MVNGFEPPLTIGRSPAAVLHIVHISTLPFCTVVHSLLFCADYKEVCTKELVILDTCCGCPSTLLLLLLLLLMVLLVVLAT